VTLSLSLATLFKIDNPDVWFHLAAGETFWRLHGLIPREVLTYCIQGRNWQAFEWLHQVVLYGLYRLGGFRALAAAKALLVSCIALISLSLGRRVCGSLSIAALATVGLINQCRVFFVERPQLWDYFFVVCIVYCIHSYFTRGDLRWLLPFPAGEALWANAHGGASFLGLAILGLAILSKRDGRLAAISALCGAATLVNPWGFHVYTHAWNLLHMPILSHFSDWQKPGLGDGVFVALWITSVIGAVLGMRRERFLSLVVIFFSLLSLQAYRHVPFLCLSSIPLTALLFKTVCEPLTRRIGDPWKTAAVLLAGSLLLSRIGYQMWFDDFHWRRVGIGPGIESRVESATAFILNNHLHGRMFNTLGLGGLLEWRLWPEERTFMDGRAQVEFGPELIQRTAYWDKGDNWRILDERYRFDYVVVPTLAKEPGDLTNSRDWALVFWDDNTLIYVRRLPKFASLIKRQEFKILKPNDRTLSFLYQEQSGGGRKALVQKELLRSLRESPNHFLADFMLVDWSVHSGETAAALRWARDGVAAAPWRADAYDTLSWALEHAGRFREAFQAEKQACRLDLSGSLFSRRLARLAQRIGEKC
jgi:hypothetical protein